MIYYNNVKGRKEITDMTQEQIIAKIHTDFIVNMEMEKYCIKRYNETGSDYWQNGLHSFKGQNLELISLYAFIKDIEWSTANAHLISYYHKHKKDAE